MASLPSLKPLLKTFRQPTWLAVFTSAAIHGALFAASPSFSSSALTLLANPGEWNRPHTVPLVELTPEEQNRLPAFSNRSLSLSPEFNRDDLFNTPATAPPDISDSFASDPLSGGLPQDWLQIPQPPPPLTLPPPLLVDPNPDSWNLPFPIQIPDSLTADGSSAQSSSAPAPEEPPQVVDRTSSVNPEPSAASNPDDSALSARRATPEGLSELRLEELERVGDLGSLQSDGRIRISLIPGPGELSDEPGSDAANARPQSASSPRVSQSIINRLEAYASNYAYDSELTAEEAVNEALSTWTTEIQAESEVADLQPTSVELPPIENPVRVCLPKAPASAAIGILINPEGQIVDPPRLLKSTGYGVLNNWALQSLGRTLENQDFSQVDSYQALKFEIPINYDAEGCIDRARLTRPNS